MVGNLVLLALFVEVNVYVCASLGDLVVNNCWRPHHLLLQSVDCVLISDGRAQDLLRFISAGVLLVYVGEVLAGLEGSHLHQVLAYVGLHVVAHAHIFVLRFGQLGVLQHVERYRIIWIEPSGIVLVGLGCW